MRSVIECCLDRRALFCFQVKFFLFSSQVFIIRKMLGFFHNVSMYVVYILAYLCGTLNCVYESIQSFCTICTNILALVECMNIVYLV